MAKILLPIGPGVQFTGERRTIANCFSRFGNQKNIDTLKFTARANQVHEWFFTPKQTSNALRFFADSCLRATLGNGSKIRRSNFHYLSHEIAQLVGQWLCLQDPEYIEEMPIQQRIQIAQHALNWAKLVKNWRYECYRVFARDLIPVLENSIEFLVARNSVVEVVVVVLPIHAAETRVNRQLRLFE